MKTHCSIVIEDPDQKISDCLKKEMESKRSTLEIKAEKDKTRIMINSVDFVSFRAVVNSITKQLAVFEKMEMIEDGKRN